MARKNPEDRRGSGQSTEVGITPCYRQRTHTRCTMAAGERAVRRRLESNLRTSLRVLPISACVAAAMGVLLAFWRPWPLWPAFGLMALTLIGDLVNVAFLRRRLRRGPAEAAGAPVHGEVGVPQGGPPPPDEELLAELSEWSVGELHVHAGDDADEPTVNLILRHNSAATRKRLRITGVARDGLYGQLPLLSADLRVLDTSRGGWGAERRIHLADAHDEVDLYARGWALENS